MFTFSVTAETAEELMEKLKEAARINKPRLVFPVEQEVVENAVGGIRSFSDGPIISQAQMEENVKLAPVHEMPKQPTIEEVRAALKELRERKGAGAVREILKAYGVDTLGLLKEEDYLGAMARAQSEV